MVWRNSITIALAAMCILAAAPAFAFVQYNDGCQNCHGAFTDGTSQKGSTFPNDNKHTMHRSSSYMNTDCALCHRSDDGNNPFIGSSDGTTSNPGIGCTGCHPTAGLRLHHQANAVDCTSCHAAGTPAPENIAPTYYGTPDTNVTNPCNLTASSGVNENWTTNCCEGSDTDGDNLYDGADPDCAAAATPGEAAASAASRLKVTAYNRSSGTLTVSYGVACSATNNTIEYGPLASLPSYGYSGQVCNIGNTGSGSFALPASGSYFFLVVGHDASKEGSYGKRKNGTERPEDTTIMTCPFPQDLVHRCDP